MTLNINLDDKEIKADSKNNDKKRKSRIIITSIVLGTLFLILGGVFFAYQHFSDKFNIGYSPFTSLRSAPELRKDSSGIYTNAMIIGIDARDESSGLQNTDTIMLVSYNHETSETIMISIPRDFFVQVPNQGWYTKINGIYSIAERHEAGSGLPTLQSVVEDITNTEIQYHGMVNLAAFTELINALGGVEVDVENSFTDYRYPVEGQEHRHQVVSFEEGEQFMDGERALQFVRSRYSPDPREGSDFARARRQQRVMVGIKDRLLSSETLLNPVKIWDILGVVERNIEHTRITNEDIRAAINILQEGELSSYSFVLDPSLANHQIITDRGISIDAYGVGPKAGLNNYEEIHRYLEYAFEYPEIYSQEPTILTYDIGMGYNEAHARTAEMKEKLPYINIQFQGTLLTEKQQNYIFTNTLDKEQRDLHSSLAQILNIENPKKPDFATEMILNGEYIVFLGKENENLDHMSYIPYD